MSHPSIDAVRASPRFALAMSDLERHHARFVDETIMLQQIAAPCRQEARKAAAFAAMARESGLPDVAIDAEGNVTALRRGSGDGMVAVVSHLDTVFDAATDLAIRREGTRIIAPGIADNTRGLAVQLALIRALKAAEIAHRADILFVASVGEEGLGDLRGVKHLMHEGPYRDRISTFVALDGSTPHRVVNTAVGSRRYEMRYTGPGGHSLMAFGTVSPAYALAGAIAAMARIEVPPGTTYSVGLIGGGTSINAIPTEAWMQVDLRSSVPAELDAIETRILEIAREAAEIENTTRTTRSGMVTLETKRVGDRPCGRTDPDEEIVRIAQAAVAAAGWTPELTASSTDANVAISLGVPAVTIASGIGGRAHSRDEYLDLEPSQSLRQLDMALATLLAAAGADL